jgi:putative phosphoribosyl transferase
MNLLKDRHQAGKLLAKEFDNFHFNVEEVCVLALPRGGVPVGREIAHHFGCPLDMLFVKKIGAPEYEELAIGAVCEDSQIVWNEDCVSYLNLCNENLQQLANEKRKELRALLKKWRGGLPPLDVTNKTVLVVDDGLATGTTMLASLQHLARKNPRRIIVGVPVASSSAVELIAGHCDHIVALYQPEPFYGVGQWYDDFVQVTDRDVRKLLNDSVDTKKERQRPFRNLSEGGRNATWK